MPPFPVRHASSRVAVGGFVAAALLVSLVAGAAGAPPSSPPAPAPAPAATSWSSAGHDIADTHAQPLEYQIGTANVKNLAPKWVLQTAGDVSATPAVVGGDVYVPDWGGYLYKLNATTGQVIWKNTISTYDGIPGSVSRTGPAVDGNTVVIGDQGNPAVAAAVASCAATQPATAVGTCPAPSEPDGYAHVMAVNATTGHLIWSTEVSSNPASIITGSPVIYDGVVYVGVSSEEEALADYSAYPCCDFQGSLVALSEYTGRILWQTHTVPAGYTGGSIWDSTPAIDPQAGLIYAGTGNNYTVPPAATTCVENAIATNTSDADCTAPDDYFDAIVAFNMDTGAIVWGHKVEGFDAWTTACENEPPGVTWCPSAAGPDYDMGGAGPNLFTIVNPTIHRPETLVGIGQKSGIYWTWDAVTGAAAWETLVGPGSSLGGMEWGTAYDGQRIYVAIANLYAEPYTLGGSGSEAGTICDAGSWAALDPTTGKILWQVCDPQGAMDLGGVSVANGVVYAGSAATSGKQMYALNAATGQILWSFAAGGSVVASPAIVGGTVFWGSGYSRLAPLASGNDKFFAFSLPPGPA